MKDSSVVGSCSRGDGLSLEKQIMIPPYEKQI